MTTKYIKKKQKNKFNKNVQVEAFEFFVQKLKYVHVLCRARTSSNKNTS